MMRPPFLRAAIIMLVFLSLVPFVQWAQSEVALSPPPSPPFTLTAPRVNEITYVISVKNVNTTSTWARIDYALPRTQVPDTYVKIKEVRIVGPPSVNFTYTDRGNPRMRVYTPDLKPAEQITINITFYSLRYRLDYSTHRPLVALSFPDEYAVYTQPEQYLESNNTLIAEKARTLVGVRTNPFRIAEKMYDFARSYITWTSQSDIRGALYGLQHGRGDCTEFGTLFVSLMRAAGIPARTVVGHAAVELARGGRANASSLWVDSPHLWAEFYVEGYGWVPVDPTFGRQDPESHFGTSWAYYLPMIKGPTMESPYHSLASIGHLADVGVEFTSYLVATPLTIVPFDDKAVRDLFEANGLVNLARHVADRAYDRMFDVIATYPLLETAYASLVNATRFLGSGNLELSSHYSQEARNKSEETLNIISGLVMTEAENSIGRSWREFRLLGSLGGGFYLRMAAANQNKGDFLNAVENAYLAKATADQAPNFLVFLGPVVFSILVVDVTRRKNRTRTKATA